MVAVASKTDWTAIKFQFIQSNVSVADLSRQFGIKEDTIWKRVTRGHWAELRVEAEQKAYADAAASHSKDRVRDLTQFNQDDLTIARTLRNRVAKRLRTKNEAGDELPLTAGELRMLAATAEAAQRMGRLALGASTDNVGHAGTGGEGPVAIVNVSKEEYLKAREEVLQEY